MTQTTWVQNFFFCVSSDVSGFISSCECSVYLLVEMMHSYFSFERTIACNLLILWLKGNGEIGIHKGTQLAEIGQVLQTNLWTVLLL